MNVDQVTTHGDLLSCLPGISGKLVLGPASDISIIYSCVDIHCCFYGCTNKKLNYASFVVVTILIYFACINCFHILSSPLTFPCFFVLFQRGRVDDLSFFDCLSPFCFLFIEFHCTFFHFL